ncbi:MAG TPA: uroporphyrinogen decarboxylase family protein [Chloroflexota bacterium]|jgi:uroporphyrinogen decarboxylase
MAEAATATRRRAPRARLPELTKMERVRAAVRGHEVDRVPFCFWHHFKPRANPHALAQATIEFFGGFDLDIFKIMPDIPYPFPDNSIHRGEDWYLLPETGPWEGNFGRQLQTVQLLRELLGDEAPILLTVFSPITYAMRFGGRDRIREHMTEHPVDLHAGLGVISRNLATSCEAAIDVGADGIFLAVQGAGDSLLTPAEYAEFARPYELHVLRASLGGWLTTLHVHAASGLDIEPFLAYPAPVLSWSDRLTGISLRDVRRKAPEKCLMGGLSERGPITNGTASQILAEMKDALAQTDGGRRFILANGCSVPDDTPEDKLRLAREQVDKL